MQNENSFMLGAVIGLIGVGLVAKLGFQPRKSPTKRKQEREIKTMTKKFRKKSGLFVVPKVGQA